MAVSALNFDGSLAKIIEADGIAGVTSNPAIFAASINKEPIYQRASGRARNYARQLETLRAEMDSTTGN